MRLDKIINSPLDRLDKAQFLAQDWQKHPVLLRQALPDYQSPLSAEELAGLACEPQVEARIVIEKGGAKPWQVIHSPLKETDFTSLPDENWSVLVQSVDRHVPDIADLLDLFQFIPSWRVDDVMISYAPPNGSVGAHVDSYDVFLFQVEGQRRWDIACQDNIDCQDNLDLRILQEFTPQHSWVLNAGDMLYLPAGVAHHGVAIDDSLTFSIGFLAPKEDELIGSYVDDYLLTTPRTKHYQDPDLTLPTHAGEISPSALQKIHATLRSLPQDSSSLNRWFGRYISASRAHLRPEPLNPALSPEACLTALKQGDIIRRESRIVFIQETNTVLLFAEGEIFELPKNLLFAAAHFSEQREWDYDMLKATLTVYPAVLVLLTDLINLGALYLFTQK